MGPAHLQGQGLRQERSLRAMLEMSATEQKQKIQEENSEGDGEREKATKEEEEEPPDRSLILTRDLALLLRNWVT